MRYRDDKPQDWEWPVTPDRSDPKPSVPCEECGGTHGLHLIDCPVLLHDARLLSETDWGRGILAMNELMNRADGE